MSRPSAVLLRPAARTQARRMLAVLQREEPELLAALPADPLGALAAFARTELRLVPESGGGQGCTVAGAYLPNATPPVLLVTRSLSRRRQAFTALHEFGHHLQRTDAELGAHLLDHPDDEHLEEAACQVFASLVLIPDALVAELVPPRGADATTVGRLYERSHASRAACCVRAVEFLVGGGAVVLYRRDGVVDSTASTGLIPPAKGSDQSATPLVASALRSFGGVVTNDRTHIAYSTGTSGPLYGQAAWVGEYLVAVLKTDNASWKPFAPPRVEGGTFTGTTRWPTCDVCLDNFELTDDVCPRCQQPRCPRQHCGCASSARERRCPGPCGLTLAKSRYADFADVTTACRDCE